MRWQDSGELASTQRLAGRRARAGLPPFLMAVALWSHRGLDAVGAEWTVEAATLRDPAPVLVSAAPPASGMSGKAWGLREGPELSSAAAPAGLAVSSLPTCPVLQPSCLKRVK